MIPRLWIGWGYTKILYNKRSKGFFSLSFSLSVFDISTGGGGKKAAGLCCCVPGRKRSNSLAYRYTDRVCVCVIHAHRQREREEEEVGVEGTSTHGQGTKQAAPAGRTFSRGRRRSQQLIEEEAFRIPKAVKQEKRRRIEKWIKKERGMPRKRRRRRRRRRRRVLSLTLRCGLRGHAPIFIMKRREAPVSLFFFSFFYSVVTSSSSSSSSSWSKVHKKEGVVLTYHVFRLVGPRMAHATTRFFLSFSFNPFGNLKLLRIAAECQMRRQMQIRGRSPPQVFLHAKECGMLLLRVAEK